MSKEKVIIIKADTDNADAKVNKLKKSVQNVEKSTKDANKTFTFFSGTVDNLTDGGVTKFNLFRESVRSLTSVFKILKVAIIGTGIGALVALVAKLTQAFSRNQKVVDAVSGVFNGISIVFTQLTDAIINAYESVSKATGGFDALGKVMGGLLTLVLNPFKASFYAIKLAVQQTQLAWEKSFFGDKDPKTIKELNLAIIETKNNLADTTKEFIQAGTDIYENFGEAISEVSALTEATVDGISEINVKAAIEQGKALADARKNSIIAEAQLEKSIFKNQLLAEKQRQIRDDERLSIDDRIKANEELGKILQRQQEDELKLANQRLNTANLELKTRKGNPEAIAAVINAEKEVLDVKERIAGFESEQRVNEAALQKERLENLNEIALIGATEQERKRIEAEQELERQRLLIEKTISNEQEKNAALLLAKQEYDNALASIQAEVDAADAKRRAEQDRLNAEELQKEKILQQQKLQIVGQTFGALTEILGKNSKAGKAAAIAQATINTYQGITEVWSNKSTLPEPFGTIQKVASTATVLASGLKAVQQIKSTKLPNIAGASGGGTGGGGSVAAPQFNIVGQDSQSQVAQVIGENQQQPVQAYVVANDVTTAQSLNNNIIDGASLG